MTGHIQRSLKGNEFSPKVTSITKHFASDAFVLRCDGGLEKDVSACEQKYWQVTGMWPETQFLRTKTQETLGKEDPGKERLRHTGLEPEVCVHGGCFSANSNILQSGEQSCGGRKSSVSPSTSSAFLPYGKPTKYFFLGPNFHLTKIWISDQKLQFIFTKALSF